MNLPIPRGTRLLQIKEDDLAELEKVLPELSEALITVSNPSIRTKLRRVQQILSNVRWNYGPSTLVEIIPAGDEPPETGPNSELD